MNAVVNLGCVACRKDGIEDSPAEPHHPRIGQGQQKAPHKMAIPLCPPHHNRPFTYGVAYHAGPEIWEEKYGSQLDLVAQTQEEAGLTNFLPRE